VAGGTGTRMKSAVPKQFLKVNGTPILLLTLSAFIEAIPGVELVLVMHHDYVEMWNDIAKEFNFSYPVKITSGGAERFHSVANGIAQLSSTSGLVGVHDAVRPFVSSQTIERCFLAASQHGASIPVVSLVDSLRKVHGSSSIAEDRSAYRLVQTPQCFQMDVIKRAYEQPFSDLFTDDATVVEALGESIHLVEGNRENIKITTPDDLVFAQAWSNH